MPPFNAPSWSALVRHLNPQCQFQPGASEEDLQNLEHWLGASVPTQLRELLLETDGISGEFGEGLVWSVGEIYAQNFRFRKNPEFRPLYMPFDHLLFFGDDGGGDQFAYPIQMDGSINRHDVFRWNHETDAREWYAGRLEQFLETFLVDERAEG